MIDYRELERELSLIKIKKLALQGNTRKYDCAKEQPLLDDFKS